MALSVQPVQTGNISTVGGVPNANAAGTIYAGGKATTLANKGAFYNYISQNPGLGVDQYTNNPWGVSAQEIQGIIGNPTTTQQTGGGTTTTGGGTATGYDPASIQRSVDAQLAGIPKNEASTVASSGLGLGQNIIDTIAAQQLAQHGVDLQARQNELSKITGQRGVLDMVNHGLQSGGITLDNANASDSSAAGALARAYGILGRQAATKVGNAYELGKGSVAESQNTLNAQNVSKKGDLETQKTQIINGVVSDAQRQLLQLQAMQAQYNLPQVDVDQKKAEIQQAALEALSQYDTKLQQGFGGIAPESQDASQAAAVGMANAGVPPQSAYDFTTTPPAQFAGTGNFASNLPIFTFPGKKATA